MKEYEIKSTELVEKYNEKYRSLYDKCAVEFHAYCLLNRKVINFVRIGSKEE